MPYWHELLYNPNGSWILRALLDALLSDEMVCVGGKMND